ncbi:MAG TPA: hypothetical protein VL244_07550, partial [Alphaproteobacteria bacterium]|nr:hypothetical protein [Alphaproteobacteria bacterium]
DQVESIHIVVPAKAGTQDQVTGRCPWTPAFAGVTKEMFYLIGFSSSCGARRAKSRASFG